MHNRESVSELLIAAALGGVRQTKSAMADGYGGLCALGVLHSHIAGHEDCLGSSESCYMAVCKDFGLKMSECEHIWRLNDTKEMDFLTIARKWDHVDESS